MWADQTCNLKKTHSFLPSKYGFQLIITDDNLLVGRVLEIEEQEELRNELVSILKEKRGNEGKENRNPGVCWKSKEPRGKLFINNKWPLMDRLPSA